MNVSSPQRPFRGKEVHGSDDVVVEELVILASACHAKPSDSADLPLENKSDSDIPDSILLEVHIPLPSTVSSPAPTMMPTPSDKTVSNSSRESDCLGAVVLESDHWFGFALVYCKD